MFALMDVLASREEPVSLKEISEKAGLHLSTTHRILNDLASGVLWNGHSRAVTAWACVCWNWVIWSRAG